MNHKLTGILLLTSALQLHALAREWKSADGRRALKGEFVSRDANAIVIDNSSKKITIPFAALHPDDRTWLNENHPMPGTEIPPKSAIFDSLVFGDDRAQVTKKLASSKFVESTVSEAHFARTGLNGVFRTKSKIGGLDAMLYFDWTAGGCLKELSLQTPPLPATDLDARLVPCWTEFIKLLTTLHGKPVNADTKLDLTPIQDGSMAGTHLWKLENSASILLGAAREGDQYQITVRFTTEDIKPVITPATPPANRQIP